MNSLLWRASVRHLLRHPAQLALALAGLALGVATIAAVDIATASAHRAFQLSLDAVNGAATHQLVSGPGGIDEQLYADLKVERTTVDFAPIVEGYVVVGDRTMQLIGIDPFADPGFHEPSRAAETGVGRVADPVRWFTEPGGVLLAAATASELGIEVNETFEIRIGGQVRQAKLLGLVGEDRAGYDTVMLTDIAQAQEWLGLIGRLSRIDVRIPEGPASNAVLEQLRTKLPEGVFIREAQRSSQQSFDLTSAFTTNLQAMSLLALLVSAFLIYSAISFAVVQRRQMIGVLRALGATRRAILTIILTESALIGIVGAGLGLAGGIAIGRELIALVSRTINDLYFVVSVNEVAIPASSVVKAIGCGLGVALLAALLPASEAAGSAPQLGMRRSVLEARALSLSKWLVLVSVVLALASAITVWLSGRSLFAGFVALFLLLLSVAAITPAALRVLARFAANLAGRRSATARLAFGDVAASLSRTGIAVAALGLAITAMLGVSIMVASFRESLREWLASTLRADIYVSAPGPGFGRPERRIEPEIVETLLANDAIADYTTSRRVLVESPQGQVPLEALNLARESYEGITLTQGNAGEAWAAFEKGAVIVSEPLAWNLGIEAGDTLTLNTASGPRSFPVAGVYREYGSDRGNLYINRTVYRELWRDDAISALGLHLKPGSDTASVIAELRAAVAGRQALFISSNADVRELSMSIFERTFVITRVLYWLAAGVAAIGLVSALLAWELERSRELALLRSLGLTPRGTAVLVGTQTIFMGLAALLAAIPTGVLTGLLLIDVINRRAFGWQIDLHLNAAQFANALGLAVAASAVAALYPAWRSGRAPVASEIRAE